MNKNIVNLLLTATLAVASGIACSNLGNSNKSDDKPSNGTKSSPDAQTTSSGKPAKLDSYAIKGIKFAYYKIPSGLKKEELIEVAQKIHDQDSDAQLVLVDDDTELADYIKYAKAISGIGEIEKPMPVEWADKHIIANVQKYMSGKFVLCEGYGSSEIADLK
ncbi:MAG: hypothetical protein IPJ55_07640 [Chloracidobacterium sp.]|nr:hypothetical protein [Chloracidobacterium sp.]